MTTLNLGILAHVDAGKTTLTERLLFTAGVIDETGSVDDGSTQTDSLALERQRGITIKSAVVSFAVDDVTVNLIDTPGHPDFIAEVERVLSVLDGAVLVVSAVEGVQAQTRVLMRVLQRLRLPTLIFVNKIDRAGAECDRLLESISRSLTPAIIPMGSVRGLGTRGARYAPHPVDDAGFLSKLVDLLADHDDDFLAAYVRDETAFAPCDLRRELAAQARRALVHPVYFGSAITGAGVESLVAGIKEMLPAAEGDAGGPVSGTVFKIERGAAGEKIAYVRMVSGTVRTRDRMRIRGACDGRRACGGRQTCDRRGACDGDGARGGRGACDGKVTAISVFAHGSADRRASVTAGQIAKLWGLGEARVGDTIGEPATPPPARHFAPPTLETIVVPCRPADAGALHVALSQLAEQDPLINMRDDGIRQEISVSLYGEVQKEVIQATLADEFGIGVTFRETTTICIERPVSSGAAVEVIDKGANPFLATVGLRVEPAPVNTGVRFRLEVELGSIPLSFHKAVEETVLQTLSQGLYGWQVTDCVVTMTHSGYWPRQSHAHAVFDKSMSSTAGDFRNLTPLVLMSALKQAGTVVSEPIHRFRLDAPASALATLLPALRRLGAVPHTPAVNGSSCLIDGEIPAAQVHEMQKQLHSLTRGEGVLDCAFGHYRPVRGTIPFRPRSDDNPLNREEYLLRVRRNVRAAPA